MAAIVSLRIDFDGGRLGPGKVALLEAIAATGSISAAGRAMGMSYRRAWTLVDDLNRLFRSPLVEAQPGGSQGGGAALTDLGRDVVRRYRAVERAAVAGGAEEIRELEGMLAPIAP